MDDYESPNRASNMEKAEGERDEDITAQEDPERARWTSDPDTIERRDRERPESGATADPESAPHRA